jgi:alpha-beta hydrolase superfamily lysophospholipase
MSDFQPEQLLAAALPPLATFGQEPAHGRTYRSFYGLDALRSGVRGRLGSFRAGPYRLAAQVWLPERPVATLLMLHGYYDHMGLYGNLVDWALSLNFAVLACDLPGHGLSSGKRASIDDFGEYQAVLHGLFAEAEALRLPRPWHLCGQSTGGAILLDYLLHGRPRPELGQTILLAPLVRPRAWKRSQLSYHLVRPFVDAIPRRFSVNSSDAEFIDFVHHQDPLQPRILPTAWVGALARWIPRIEGARRSAHSPLIVQGEQDETVEWQHNLNVLDDKFSQPRRLLLPEARHHLVNEREALRQQYFEFLSRQLG